MPEIPTIVNEKGTIPGFPTASEIMSRVKTTAPNPGIYNNQNVSSDDLYLAALQKAKPGGVPTIPLSSVYIGNRYTETLPGTDYEEAAAQQQTGWGKLGNGLGKMVGTATTSFLGGTVGTVAGIGSMLINQRFASLYDNPVNRQLDEVNKYMVDALPNYYTHKEKDAEWYSPDAIWTGNFFTDGIISNLGYSIGSIAGGAMWSKALSAIGKASKLVQAGKGLETAEQVTQAIKEAPKMGRFGAVSEKLTSLTQKYVNDPVASLMNNGNRVVTSVMGSVGEASMEALQNMNEYRDTMIKSYRDKYGKDPEGADLEEINAYSDKIGNLTWGANVALLTGTNYVQLPKILGSSRRIERAMINDVEKVGGKVLGDFAAQAPMLERVGAKALGKTGATTGRLLTNYVGRPLSLLFSLPEAFEEGSQYAIQKGVGEYFNRAYQNKEDLQGFLGDLNNGLKNILGEGVEKTLTEKEGMTNVLIGGISGGLQTSFSPLGDNSLRERGLFGTGGVRGKNTALAVEALNKTKLADVLKSRINYLGIGITSQKLRQEAIANNDKLAEKDYEADYTLSYLMPRIKYGKISAVKQELEYYKAQAMSDAGFEELQAAQIVNANETKPQFIARLDRISKTADAINRTYDIISDKYTNVRDEKGNRVYTDDVVDKMVYASAKIVDYDDRLVNLEAKLQSQDISTSMSKDALYNSKEWADGDIKGAANTAEFIEATTGTVKDIEKKFPLKETQDDAKQDFADYLDMVLSRRLFIDEYNELTTAPEKFKAATLKREMLTSEEVEKAATAEGLPKEFVVVPSKIGPVRLEVGKTYMIGKVQDQKTAEGYLLFRAPEITILGENEDGTIKIRTSEGEEKDISKKILEGYNVGTMENLKSKSTAYYYYQHWNDVFTFNFGKERGGVREGRLQYDSSNDKLFFVYLDKEGKRQSKELNRGHFVAQQGFTEPRIKPVRTLVPETAEQAAAREAFTAQQELEKEKQTILQNREARIRIISEVADSTRTRIAETEKKILEKKEKLEQVNKDLEALREIRVSEARTKDSKRLFRHLQKFAKVFATTTRSITTLARLKEDTEYELNKLESERDELLFNLGYFEDMAQNMDELPEHSGAFRNELKKQVSWIQDMAKQTASDITTLSNIAKEAGNSIKNLVELLADATKAFDKDYPPYLQEAYERMAKGDNVLAQIPLVKSYLADKAFIEDINKEIAVKEADIQAAQTQINDLVDLMGQLEKEARAKQAILDRYEEEVRLYKAAKAKEAAILKNKQLQDKFFSRQQTSSTDSGDTIAESADANYLDEENQKLNSAKHRVEVAWSSTIVTSDETIDRPSDDRHDAFLSKIDLMPADKRARMRRIFITKNNEEAFGLKGITEEHLQGYTPKEGEELILAVYVTTKEDEDGWFLVDQEGNPLTKLGETAELGKVVWAAMPSESRYNSYGTRYVDSTPEELVEAYEEAWKEKRKDILSQTDSILEPEPFFVSNGIMINNKGERHPVEGTLVSKEQLDNNQPVLIISTKGEITHENRTIKTPQGRMYISNGGTLRIVNNRNITEKEADTIFDVLKAFVEEANTKKTWNSLYSKYLQGLLYFKSPYQKKEDEVVKNRTSRNQFYFHKGYFYFGQNEVPVPFTVEGLEANKEEVKFFLRNAYNNVNNTLLSKNEPFSELESKDGNITVKKEWPSYQHYLLSSEGRTAQELPLYTDIQQISPDIPNDSNYEKGSRSTYSYSTITIKDQPVSAPEAEEKEVTPEPVKKKSKFEAAVEALAAQAEEAAQPAPAKPKTRMERAAEALQANQEQDNSQKAAEATPETVVPAKKSPVKKGATEKFDQAPLISIDSILGARSNKPAPKPDSGFRVAKGSDYALADLEAEKQYIEENTPFSVEVVENLIEAGNGLYAFGSYVDGVVTLSEKMEIGTGYHEAFEGVYNSMLSPKEKARILNEFASREGTFIDRETGKTVAYKDATVHQAKEQMAEEFRDKKLYGIDPPQAKTSWIKSFFQKLIDFINSVLDPASVKNLNEVFTRMDAAYYKSAPKYTGASKTPQYRLKIGDLDVKDSYTVVRNVVSRIFKTLMEEGKFNTINELDFTSFASEPVYEQVYNSMLDTFNEIRNTMTDEQFADSTYATTLLSIVQDWDKVKAYSREILKTFKIVEEIEEEYHREGESSEYGGNNSDSYVINHFAYDAKANAPASVKLLIATIQESMFASVDGKVRVGELSSPVKSIISKKDDSTGLEMMIDYAKMFNYTLEQLRSKNTLKEKEAAIKELAQDNPNFVRLYNRLGIAKNSNLTLDQWALKVKFYSTMSKQRPVPVVTYLQEDGTTTIGAADVRDAVNVLSNNFLDNLKNDKAVKYEDGKFLLSTSSFRLPIKTPKDQYAFLRKLGIDFTPTQQANISKSQQKKIADAVTSISYVLRKNDKINISTLNATDLKGPLTSVLEIFIKSDNMEPESTLLNLEGQRVQQNIQTNTISRISNDINNSANKEELIKKLPHLAGEYAQDSLYLNSVIFNEEGVRVKQGFEPKYVMGVLDVVDNNAVPTDKLSKQERLSQAINQNLAGNYYVLLNADSKTEFMLGMENMFDTVDEKFLAQMFSYYQTEQDLGTSKRRLFEFLGDDLTREQFDKRLTKFIEDEVAQQRKELEDFQIISPSKNEFYEWNGLYKDYATNNKLNHEKLSDAQINQILTFRTINYMVNNTEIHKIYFGDPAAYDDPTKRYKSFQSPREQSVYDTPEFDAALNATYNTVEGTPLKKGDPGYHLHSDRLKTVVISDVLTSEALPGYENNKSTDGQAIAPLSAYKEMRIKNGYRWSSGDERQYQYEMAKDRLAMEEDGLLSYKGRQELKRHDQDLVKAGSPLSGRFSPIKPIVSGFSDDHPLLDKYSVAPITYSATRASTLGKQYKRMLDQNISYMVYPSARKVGVTAEDSMYNADGSVNTNPFKADAVTAVPYKWFGIQTETIGDPKKQTMGSQSAKLITVNLMSGAVPSDVQVPYEDWEKLSEQEKGNKSKIYKLIQKEKRQHEELIEEGYKTVLDKVGINPDGTVDNTKLLETILDELTRRDLNENLRAALEIDEDTQEFKIPLEALSNYEQIKNILYSYIDKYIASPKVNGGAKIQVSGSGWEVAGKRVEARQITDKKTGKKRTIYTSAGLSFYTKDKPYMEVLMPAWFGEKLRKAGIDLDKVRIEDIDEEVLKGIGFRIPTQELNSIEVFKVVGFLPESMGDTVVVPEALVTKTGSDFDVDKLNSYLKNIYINSRGQVKMVPFAETKEETLALLSDLWDAGEFLTQAQQQELDRIIEEELSALEDEGLVHVGQILGKEDKGIADTVGGLFKNIPFVSELFSEQAITREFVQSFKKKEATKDQILQKLYKQSLENNYFTTFEEILSLPENFERLTTPNSSDELIAMRDKLVGISPEEFGEGAIKSVLSPTYMNNIRHNYLLGKGGVGIAAVAQTGNSVGQKSMTIIDPTRIAKLKDDNEKKYIKDGTVKLPSNTVTLKGKVYHTLSMAKDKAGRYISDKISQYINGFVDIAKDAFLMQIGVNRSNAATYLTLERLGVPTETAILFMNQPVVREFQKMISKSDYPTFLYQEDIINDAKALFPTSKTITSFGEVGAPVQIKELDKKLESNISDYYKDKKTFNEEQRAFQQFVLDEFLKYYAISSNLFRLNQGANWDTANFNSPYLVEKKLMQAENARNNNIFSSVDELVGRTFIAKTRDTIVDLSEKLSNSFFAFLNDDIRPYFLPIVKEVILRKGQSERDSLRAARKVEESFTDYLIQNMTMINSRIEELLINEQTALINAVRALQFKVKAKENSTLYQNPILARLIAENRVQPEDTKVIKIFDKHSDVFSQNTDIAAMEELKNNPVTKDLYSKLVRVAFLQSGVAKSPISFTDIIPIEDFSKVVLLGMDGLNNPSLLKNFIATDSFYRNNWKNPDIVPAIKEKFKVDRNTGETYSATRYNFPGLELFKVSTKSKVHESRFATIRTGKGKNAKTYFLKRVEYDNGNLFTKPYSPKHPDNVFSLYVAVNAWGDGFKGKEYYDHIRKSVYNNGTVKIDNELSGETVISMLTNTEKVKPVAPQVPATTPKKETVQVKKIISGGQTGVDRIGLIVGKQLGLQTGGTTTPGYYTEKGKDLTLKTEFGVQEISKELQKGKAGKEFYLPRTEQNVLNSDGTVYFSTDEDSAGLIATRRFAQQHDKPFLLNPSAAQLAKWLSDNSIETLNVAGNRGSKLSETKQKEIENILATAFSGATQQAPVSKTAPAAPAKTITLKDGKKYSTDDIDSILLRRLGYTTQEIVKILKQIC